MLTDDFAEFEIAEYHLRVSRLRERMETEGLQAVLLCTDTNHRYYSGHWSHRWMHKFTSQFLLLPLEQDPVLVVPPLETGICALDSWVEDVRTYHPPIRVQAGVALITELASELGLDAGRWGVEAGGVLWSRMPIDDFTQLQTNLPRVEFVDASNLLWSNRFPKSSAEIDYIQKAVTLTDAAFARLFGTVRPGMSERDLHQLMAVHQLELGAESPGSITVASHPAKDLRSSDQSHRRATDRKLQVGDLVIMDAGCVYRGYWSDYTRMFAIGKAEEHVQTAYRTIYAALQASLSAIRPGVPSKTLVEAAIETMKRDGFQEQAKRVSGAGHASGLDIIEPPFIELEDNTPLEAGMILTVEPSMITDYGFFMLEEDVVVREDGYELLSAAVSSELPIL